MIVSIYSKSHINKNYAGPKAIFDPCFIPPKILHRKEEENSLFSLLNDSIYDNFSLNILYQGIQGIGKKVIINKVINDLSLEKDLNRTNTFSIDCHGKKFEEILISLLHKIKKRNNLKISYDSMLNADLSYLWNLLKLSFSKMEDDAILILTNSEQLKPSYFRKFLSFGKESNITIVSTINKLLRSSTLDLLTEFDMRKKLSYFSYKELFSILKQRVNLTFQKQIDKDFIEYLTDLIFENYVPVPGKGIELLKDFYPYLDENRDIDADLIFEICRNQFDSSTNVDEFTMLSFLSGEDILVIMFLDNLINYFDKKFTYYISGKDLEELYYISCESMQYPKSSEEFDKLVIMFCNLGILALSQKSGDERLQKMENPVLSSDYFILMNPKQLKAVIDTLFNS